MISALNIATLWLTRRPRRRFELPALYKLFPRFGRNDLADDVAAEQLERRSRCGTHLQANGHPSYVSVHYYRPPRLLAHLCRGPGPHRNPLLIRHKSIHIIRRSLQPRFHRNSRRIHHGRLPTLPRPIRRLGPYFPRWSGRILGSDRCRGS